MAFRCLTSSLTVLSLALWAPAGCFSPDDPTQLSETADDGSTADSPTTGAPTTGSPTTNTPTTGSPTTNTPTTGDPTTDTPTTDDTSDPTTGDPTDDTTGDPTKSETTDAEACSVDELCIPEIPAEWTGPIAAGDAGDCPAGYPTAGDDLFDGLVPGISQCQCNCSVSSVQCDLWLENSDQEFDPVGSCDEPPFDDECLSAVTQSTCADNGVDVPATPQWNSTLATCGGATAGATCDGGGTCFADDGGFGDICIQRDGDHPCPSGFDDRSLLHEDFSDTRECSGCDCSPSGQACEIDIEVCSVGFFEVTLESGGSCQQLNSGESEAVSLLSTVVTNQGSCTATAGSGMETGDVIETGPVTVCCM